MSGTSVTGCLSTEDNKCATAGAPRCLPTRVSVGPRVPSAQGRAQKPSLEEVSSSPSRMSTTMRVIQSTMFAAKITQLQAVSERADSGLLWNRLVAIAEVTIPAMAHGLQHNRGARMWQIGPPFAEPLPDEP